MQTLKDVNVRYDPHLKQYDVFEQDRQNIVQNYHNSIELTRDNLADIKLRTLMSRNYLNTIIKYKTEVLTELARDTNN